MEKMRQRADPPGMVNRGCPEWIAHDYAELHKVLSPGKAVAIDDGLLSLTVEAINGTDVVCRVNNTVMLGETKGINLPGSEQHKKSKQAKDVSSNVCQSYIIYLYDKNLKL